MDDDLRAAERAWRAAPEDARAHERWIEARLRAGIAVDHEELDLRLHPARKLAFPCPARVRVIRPNEREWLGQAEPGRSLTVPAGRHLSVSPPLDPASLAALDAMDLPAGTGLALDLTGSDAVGPTLSSVSDARWTHLKLTGLPLPCAGALGQVAALPRLISLHLGLRPAPDRPLATREDLQALTRAPGLTALVLDCPQVGFEPGALAAAAGPGLRTLRVRARGPESLEAGANEELAELARAAPELRRLELQLADGRQFGDEGLTELARCCAALRVLTLPWCPSLTDAGVAALAGLPLRELALYAPRDLDAAAPILAALPLERLTLDAGAMSPEALRMVCARPSELRLSLHHLDQLPGLDASGDRLVELTLHLGPEGDVDALRHLGALPGLRTLAIFWDGLDGGLPDLSGCRELTDLSLWNVIALDRLAARRLNRAPLESLTISGAVGPAAHGERIDAAALRALAAHPTLEFLDLTRCATLTDEVLLAFADAPKLELLRIWGCAGITQAGVDALRAAAGSRLEVMFEALT